MKLTEPKITFLINRDSTEITIEDSQSSTEFVRVVLTPGQLSRLLSREGSVICEASVHGLEKIGKTHENKYFDFEIDPGIARKQESKELDLYCNIALEKEGMSEWVSDGYYGSQNSFFTKDGKSYARSIIRRWI